MVRELLLRQAYRLYAAVLVIWGAWTLSWSLFGLEMASTTVGYGWLAIAAVGVPVTVGLFATRRSLFEAPAREVDRFTANSLSGWPLVAYAAALVGWSAVFAAWWSGTVSVSSTVVGYGWLAIAAYGTVLTIGLVSTHRSEVLAAVGVQTPENSRV